KGVDDKPKFPERADGPPILEQMGKSRFIDTPVCVYQSPKDETPASVQLKLALPAGPARPRDYLVLVDTSASKAAGYFAVAQKVAQALVAPLGPDDRLGLATANVDKHDLSRGVQS